MTRTRALLATLALFAATVVVAGCSQGSVFQLEVGDCFNDPDDTTEISDVPIVDCSEPHDNEVFANPTYADEDVYPGQDALAAFADEQCYAAFEPYVGIAYEESSYYIGYYFPSDQSWSNGDDRTINCLLYGAEGQTTGSAAGSAM